MGRYSGGTVPHGAVNQLGVLRSHVDRLPLVQRHGVNKEVEHELIDQSPKNKRDDKENP